MKHPKPPSDQTQIQQRSNPYTCSGSSFLFAAKLGDNTRFKYGKG